MELEWKHDVSLEWLEQRKSVITATELAGLIPSASALKKVTKAQLAGTDPYPACAALWERKHSSKTSSTSSYGAAAWGHFAEPYAVDMWNNSHPNEDDMWHWDDCIIVNSGIGFSPDSLDIEQPRNCVRLDVKEGMLTDGESMYSMPTKMLEIKSYEIDHHVKNMIADKMSLPERKQIAVAMMVLPSIEVGNLVHFNPDARHRGFAFEYTREELADDIAMLSTALDLWNKTCRIMESMPKGMDTEYTREKIWEIEMKPSLEQSVFSL